MNNYNLTETPSFVDLKMSKFAMVGNINYDKPIEGRTYLVYHEQTGEPTYSLCIYENGNWIPYGTRIPVTDKDYWICVDDVFTKSHVDTTKETGKETLQEFVTSRHKEIEQEERDKSITRSHESRTIQDLNRTVDILMEYIQKIQDDIIDKSVIEKNLEYLKNITNDLLDRIIRLEEKLGCTPPPYVPPVTPYPIDPITPITPYRPNPNPYPFGPFITYSVPEIRNSLYDSNISDCNLCCGSKRTYYDY